MGDFKFMHLKALTLTNESKQLHPTTVPAVDDDRCFGGRMQTCMLKPNKKEHSRSEVSTDSTLNSTTTSFHCRKLALSVRIVSAKFGEESSCTVS